MWASFKGYTEIVKLLENHIYFRENVDIFTPSYNILLYILINERRKHTSKRKYKHTSTFMYNLPNEIILLIKMYGEIICGRNFC